MNYLSVSFVAMHALAEGKAAPEIEAATYEGKKISLSILNRQGSVVLVFLRGFG